MRSRAFVDLANLRDPDLFEALAQGLALLAEHVSSLCDGVAILETAAKYRAASSLHSLANEEAGKFLLLLDAARCPRQPQSLLSSHLKRASDHVAKGIYSVLSHGRPADLAEVERYVVPFRSTLVLDGPEGFEWIFRNPIEDGREACTYVDYVDPEQDAAPHEWNAPPHEALAQALGGTSPACELVSSLARVGIATRDGVCLVADLWRDLSPESGTGWGEIHDRNRQTFEALDAAGLASGATAGDRSRMIEQWTFPLWQCDLSRIPVSREELKERQAELAAREWALDRFVDWHDEEDVFPSS